MIWISVLRFITIFTLVSSPVFFDKIGSIWMKQLIMIVVVVLLIVSVKLENELPREIDNAQITIVVGEGCEIMYE